MILSLHIIAIAILGLSALAAAAANVRGRRALDVASAGCVAACLLGFGAALAALLHGPDDSWRGLARLPMGEISLGIDALSSVFLLLVFAVAGLAAAFGRSYLASYEESYPLAPAAALFNLLVASMAALLLARDGVFFLLAWEAMSLASYFLVAFEDLEPQVRRAGLLYLVASHFGAACLLV
ncbi:MAG: oxidoreductase, partial [Candidatus Wallbacteria bacterium]|nr:oxidoreductase [Candidatus Wallbacteria bacterium]